MVKMNKFNFLLVFSFGMIALCFPTFVWAQTAAPGSGGGTSIYDVYNKAQQDEQNRIDSTKGQDTGENYGVENAAKDAIYDAAKDVADTASESAAATKKEWDEGNYGSAVWEALKGVVKTGTSFSLSGFKIAFSFFSNLTISGDIYEYVDPSTGETIQYTKTIFGGASAIRGNLKGCPPLPIAVADASSCIFCPLFTVIYGAAQEMTDLSFKSLATPMAMVMLVGFALYIAFKVLMHVSSFTRQDAPSFINELLVESFKVLLAFLFLMNPDQIFQHFVSPVLGAGLEFGSAMLFQASDMAQQCLNLSVENDTALLPVTLYAKLDCFIRTVQTEIAVNQAIGSSLMCAGRNAAAGKIAGFWDFNMVFQGLFIWGFALMLSLAFAFYLIDAVVTLGLVGALMPFLIACWPFKITNKYSKTGIEMLLNVFFTFVFVGIVISINIQLIGQAMNGSSLSADASTAGASTASGLSALAEALSGDNIDELKELTDLGAGGFLILIFCCIFGFKFSSQSSTLANKMAGGAGISIAPGIGGMAVKGATNIAKGVTQPARAAGANKIAELTSKAGNAVGSKLGLGKFGGKTGAKPSSSQNNTNNNRAPTPDAPKPTTSAENNNRQSPTGGNGNKDDLRNERNASGDNNGSDNSNKNKSDSNDRNQEDEKNS